MKVKSEMKTDQVMVYENSKISRNAGGCVSDKLVVKVDSKPSLKAHIGSDDEFILQNSKPSSKAGKGLCKSSLHDD